MLLFLPGLICDARTFAAQTAAFADSRAIEGYGLADSLPAMAQIVLEQAPDEFDLVFVYPWPDEEGLVAGLFERHARPGALLLTAHGCGDLRLRRKAEPARPRR